jgi:hypothetical protein
MNVIKELSVHVCKVDNKKIPCKLVARSYRKHPILYDILAQEARSAFEYLEPDVRMRSGII